MKIRNGFVSNSSSSSFIIGAHVDDTLNGMPVLRINGKELMLQEIFGYDDHLGKPMTYNEIVDYIADDCMWGEEEKIVKSRAPGWENVLHADTYIDINKMTEKYNEFGDDYKFYNCRIDQCSSIDTIIKLYDVYRGEY